MYRSFMTCDDPKGVVECGAIRKSRSGSQKMKDKMKSRRTAEKSEASFPKKSDREEMVPKGSTQSSVDPSSLQLMEVSRGAQRLNNMIDTWSRDRRCNGRSGDIAKDLLKGALDLQESLVMLRKLQEASQHKSCSKKKQNEKPQRGRIDAKMMDYTNKVSEQSYPMGYERPCLSVDGSSRNCTEELKKVIKDSLVRQNLFTMPSSEGLDSASEIPSTSSSQSSGIHTDRLSDSSFSSGTSKVRGNNLVAKLMGLEEAPSRPLPAAAQKQLQGEKILNQKRPTFEIDIPKLKKTSNVIEKVDPERRKTLSEILDAIHFKGFLKKSSVLEPNLWIHHSDDYHPKQSDDLPPIVLMKPRCCSYQESIKSPAPVPPKPEGLSLRKPKAEVVPSKSFKQKGSTSMGSSMKDVTKRLTHEEKPRILNEFVKLDEKAMMPVEKSPNMVKSYSHISHKPQVQEAIEKKAKVKTVTKKLPEKEIIRPKILTKSQDRGEITSTKSRTSPSELTIIKEIPCQHSTALIISSKTKTTKHKDFKQRKNQNNSQKLIPEPEAAKPIDEQSGREEEKSVAVPCKDDCAEIRTIAEHAVEFPVEHEVDASPSKIDDCYQSSNSLGNDVAPLKVEHGIDATSAEEAYGGESDSNADKQGAELKYFLLTNPLFIGHAEELLNLDVDCPMTQQKYEINGIANPRLYLDCAKELAERKSLQDSHPILLTRAGNSRVQISLDKLVEEIYNATEKLKFYTMISADKFSVDNVYAMMKRDIMCHGLINGIWDWGWRYGFSADESEQVVNEVEGLVLSGLIEELIVDL
ncbi:uncharacterized protein LOC114744463 isoform X2 [Neltuma alba]|uniref:uncharacterized protein LOC114731044 isoform X2 n=1 Tax=Neltuma alba TaxID=207710 RepID=UPI0010A47C6E|nr:uncharacterized protein LOC114731044 isoform X2 [Prosopis alba]XP_028788470.1 uncharacterized protein LOC114744463 isoform X2 [Prosopis alba]